MDIYDVSGLMAAVRRLERELPGWWWKVGACQVSADCTIGPMEHSPDMALVECGNDFDRGFDCDIRQPATVADALHGAIDIALKARSEAWAKKSRRNDRRPLS